MLCTTLAWRNCLKTSKILLSCLIVNMHIVYRVDGEMLSLIQRSLLGKLNVVKYSFKTKVPLIPHFNTNEDVDRSINKLKRMGFKNISQIKYIEREAKFDSKQ